MTKELKWFSYLPYLLFLIYLINGIFIIPQISITNDEQHHFSYSLRVLKGHPEKTFIYDDGSTMPISVLNIIPRAVEQLTHPGLKKTDWGFADIEHGRYMTLLFCMLIGVFIYKWSKRLYGEKAAIFSLFLFVFCPNLNASATLLTTDAFAALFTVSTLYYFWKTLKTKSWTDLLLFSASIGMAQLAKQSLTHLLIICPLYLFFYLLRQKKLTKNIGRRLLRISVFIIVLLTVINIGFLFQGVGKSLGDYQFRSHFFNKVQSSLAFIKNVPLPFPEPYVSGLDLTKNMDEIGPGHPHTTGSNNYLFGEQRSGPFWYYYSVILFFKLPLLTLIGIIILATSALSRIRKIKFFNGNPIVFSLIYLMVFFSFFVNFEPGVRHILILLPLLYILLGKLAILDYRKTTTKVITIITVLYYLSTFYYYYPNLISYTNELIWHKKNAYKIMADSNLDYAQGKYWLTAYMKENPAIKLPTSKPDTGRFVLTVNDYLNLRQADTLNWLCNNFKPVTHFHHCYLIFDITNTELKQKGLLK